MSGKDRLWFRVQGLGFGVWGLGIRVWVWGLGFRVWGLGFRVRGLGFRVWVHELGIKGQVFFWDPQFMDLTETWGGGMWVEPVKNYSGEISGRFGDIAYAAAMCPACLLI